MSQAPAGMDEAAHEAEPAQFQLLKQRRFAPFFWTQFAGAGNDNVFKTAFTAMVTYQAARFGIADPDSIVFYIAAVFIIPFVLLSATAGQLADKYEKSGLIRMVKNLEIGIMLMGGAGFIMHSVPLLFAGVLMMGVHSTIFGPVKYAYLPQHLRQDELTGGNGLIEMGTFVSILIGTIAGNELAAHGDAGALWAAAACITIAVLGRIASGFVPRSESAQPDLPINWNPLSETWRNLVLAKQNRAVFLSLLGISWLWFFGATFLTSFFPFASKVLGGDPNVVNLLLGLFSVGIGLGSVMCERLSGKKIEIGLVPFGSIGMSVFAIDLYFASRHMVAGPNLVGIHEFLGDWSNLRVLVDLFLLALFAGFYSVPLYALIQSRCEPTHRARIIAANNILNALFMIASSIMGIVLLSFKFSIPELFLVTGILNALVAIYIYGLVPEFLVRFLAWLLVHSVYRVRNIDTHRIPLDGAAVLVCNHVSFADALVIMSESPRPIRFVMDHAIFKVPVMSFLFRSARAIPIAAAKEDPVLLEAAYNAIDAALRDGDLVCIFPEGRITKTGEVDEFRSGIARIVARTPVTVFPVALRGLWGSFFSRASGSAFASVPRPLRRGISSRLEFVVGEGVPADKVVPDDLRSRVLALRGQWR